GRPPLKSRDAHPGLSKGETMLGMSAFFDGSRLRLGAVAGLAAAVAGLASLLFAGTAAADHVECGDVISTDTRLDSDVGPCPGDGLIVRADGVTLDLGGHRVFAASPNGPAENVGIRLANVTGVTVQKGTVEGFDAGVFINMGGNNTTEKIDAINNINDMAEPFAFQPGAGVTEQPDVAAGDVTPQQWMSQMICTFGDGFTTESSDNNRIQKNNVIGNGPFGGITLVGDSDGNQVEKNTVNENNISNWTTRSNGEQGSALCGATLPGAPGMQRGREVQAIGIRLEGPGADDNVIEGNRVEDNALVGISIHSYVCIPPEGFETGVQEPNTGNLITKNDVRRTGAETFEIDDFADGISSLAQGPIGRVTCTSPDNTIVKNRSTDNMRHGISLGRTVSDTTVNDNLVRNNAGDGIHVEGPRIRDGELVTPGAVNNTLHGNKGLKNAEHDGYDGNENCDNNDWRGNRFLTVNQPCVADGGTGSLNGPGRSGEAPGRQDDGPAANRGRPQG
ncbi:MAG: right-handed parallel beta-helix repeat-containing protein, partial [Actinobacteria bacterium]|nr:right-handed parallel beta-helix repeat-containing protein [Actinomycetota bacterium]